MPLFGRKKKKQVELVVHGMTCSHCEMRVQNALKSVPGVADAEASHAREQAIVTLEPAQAVPIEALIKAVEEAGYQAETAG
jgi:Cu+-exporting ATPase